MRISNYLVRFGNIKLEKWAEVKEIGLLNRMKNNKEKGMSILEAIVASVIVGIGFIGIFKWLAIQ